MAQEVDDLLDARRKVRNLRQELLRRRIALKDCREQLKTAQDRLDKEFDDIEQRQGRLDFPDDRPVAEPAAVAAVEEPAPASEQAPVVARKGRGRGKARGVPVVADVGG